MTLNRPRFAPVNYLLGVLTGAVLVGAVWAWHSHSVATLSRNDPALLFAPSNSVFVSPSRLASYTRLSPEDLAFGEQQVQRMVKDRPEMGRDVGPNDPVWRFCAKAFAGTAIGERVYWDSSEPMTGYDCDHNGPYQGEHGYIRVRPDEAKGDKKGRPHPCEELWSLAVFELENIRGTKAFNDLWERGLAG